MGGENGKCFVPSRKLGSPQEVELAGVSPQVDQSEGLVMGWR